MVERGTELEEKSFLFKKREREREMRVGVMQGLLTAMNCV